MAKQYLVLAIALIASMVVFSGSADDAAGGSQNNLPRGLLPLGVQSYTLHPGGALHVTLPGECSFTVTVDC
nr:unnamed protein product [Digitaria exilis]